MKSIRLKNSDQRLNYPPVCPEYFLIRSPDYPIKTLVLKSMNRKKLALILSLSFFLIHCQEMQFASLSEDSRDSLSLEDSTAGLQDLQRDFVKSDKLNLVFVIDPREEAEGLLPADLLGPQFLNRFEDYNWKTTYTGSFVDELFLSDPEENKKPKAEKRKKTCKTKTLLYRLGMIAVSVFALGSTAAVAVSTGQALPCAAAAGSAAMDKAKSAFQTNEKNPTVNGQFLPFEREGKKLETYLTKDQDNYNEIFTDTFTRGTAGFFNSFDAPLSETTGISDPLAGVLLSFLRNRSAFEENSQTVYVVPAFNDTKEAIPFDRIHKVFQNIHGEDRQLEIIPLTLTSHQDSACKKKLESAGIKNPSPPENLRDSVRIGSGLNICSPRLAELLERKIKRLIRPSADSVDSPLPDLADSADSPGSTDSSDSPEDLRLSQGSTFSPLD